MFKHNSGRLKKLQQNLVQIDLRSVKITVIGDSQNDI